MLIRTHKEPGDWFQMHKQPVENPALSWKAKGILAYLMSKPPNWEVRISDLDKHAADKEGALRSGLKELEENGYLVRRREHNPETGHFQWVCIVYETPAPSDQRSDPAERKVSPSVGFPQMDNPQMENPQPNKNNPNNNDLNNNEKISAANAATPPEPSPTKTKRNLRKGSETPISEAPVSESANSANAACEMFDALAQLCQYDIALLSGKDRGILNQVGKRLRDNEKTPEHLAEFARYWYAADWRGKKGQAPRPHDVLEGWGRARQWLNNGGKNANNDIGQKFGKTDNARREPANIEHDLAIAGQVIARQRARRGEVLQPVT